LSFYTIILLLVISLSFGSHFDVILRNAALRAILPCSVHSETAGARYQINVWWS